LSGCLDASEFRALFRAHAPFLWRVLRRHGVAPADLEDVCQEVFVVVHRRLGEFQGRSSLRTWLYEIARRSALSHVRMRPRAPAPEPPLPAPDAGPERSLERQRALRWLEAALLELPEDKREAFVLYELEEMTLAEVAEAQACAVNTAHYRVTSAREQLRAAGARAQLREAQPLAARRA
jgi:RNA polymerase sigma-70 factor (ECF subfamily)